MAKAKTTVRATENKPVVTANPILAEPGIPSEAAKAFAKLEAEIEALDADDLEPINIDIPRAVSIAINRA